MIRSLNCLLLSGCLAFGALVARGQTPSSGSAAPANPPGGSFSGKVVETMNAAGYTYVLVKTSSTNLWAAAPQFSVAVGDAVTVAEGMPMDNYHSKSLNRDFDLVYFTGSVNVNEGASPASGKSAELPKGHPPITADAGKSVELPKGHPPITGVAAKQPVDLSGIKKADGGQSVAEILAGKAKLTGKQVKVRGRVVKYNGDILGKNWLHIQDGTGDAGSNDLTVTTAAKAKLGDTVLVVGNVAADRDFGGGYKYSLMIENAQVTVE